MNYKPLTHREVLGKFSDECKYESMEDFYNKASIREIEANGYLEDAEYESGLDHSANFIGGVMMFLDEVSYTDPCNIIFEGMTVKELFEILDNIPENRNKYEKFKDFLRMKVNVS